VNLGVFVLGGIILIAAGVLQLLLRPKPAPGERASRAVDGAVVRTVVFVVFGVFAVLVGLGLVPLASF
jgi:uncharacterized membrane protein